MYYVLFNLPHLFKNLPKYPRSPGLTIARKQVAVIEPESADLAVGWKMMAFLTMKERVRSRILV